MVALLLLVVSLWVVQGDDAAFEAAPGAAGDVSAMDDGGPTPPKP